MSFVPLWGGCSDIGDEVQSCIQDGRTPQKALKFCEDYCLWVQDR